RFARDAVHTFGGTDLVGHEIVEGDVGGALGGNDVAIAHARVEQVFQSVHPCAGNCRNVHLVTVHPLRVGDHRDHRQRHGNRIAVGEHDHDAGHHFVEDPQLPEVLR